jgi:hypothetical protein
MPNKAPCRDLAYQTTLGVTARIKAAPSQILGGITYSRHTLPDYEFELDAAVAAGDESITIALINPPVGVTSVSLDVGTVLRFPGATPLLPPIVVTLAESAAINVTAIAAPFDTLPIATAIAANAVAKDKALLFLPGVKNGTVAPTIKAEDATNYGSGTGTEMVVTGNSKKNSMELTLVYNNPAHQLILDYCYDDAFTGLEAYLEIAFPHGEIHEGYALLTTATPQNAVQALRAMTLEWNFQGGCYNYTKAKLVAV